MSNYTVSQEKALRQLAEETGSISYAQAVEFAQEHGLKPRSVIAKIGSLGLAYEKKPVRQTKRQEPVVFKRQFVDAIQAKIGVELETLTKMSKADLSAMVDALGVDQPQPE